MTLHIGLHLIIVSALAWASFPVVQAETGYDEITIPDSYPKDYIFALYSHNEPAGPSQRELTSHFNSLGITYQHRLGHTWLVSVGYRPQSFINQNNIEEQRPVSLMSFFNSTQRIFRLYHPFYVLAGTEILYLIPVRKMNPPITKDADFSTEIGVGVQGSIWYLLSQKSAISLDLQRWRGTKTNRLHGISINLGLGWGF